MLLKVFKHDFKTAARFEVPALIAVLCATVLGCLDISLLINITGRSTEDASAFEIISVLVSTLGIYFVFMAVASAASIMALMLYYRFYKSMIKDEAYLTLTLPVSPTKLLFGKLFSAMLWMTIAGTAVVLSLGAIFACAIAVSGESFPMQEITEAFDELFSELNISAVNWVWMVILAIVASFENMLQVFMAILFAGSIVKKYKGLAAVGMVFGINFAVSSIMQVVPYFLAIPFGLLLEDANGAINPNGIDIYLQINIWIMIVLYAALAVLFFFLSRYFIKNKVNLE